MKRSVISLVVCALLGASLATVSPVAAAEDDLLDAVAERVARMPVRTAGGATLAALAPAPSGSSSQRSVGDGVGDAVDARADVTRARLTYGQKRVAFDFDTLAFANPRTNPNWADGDSAAVWGLDFTGDRREDFAVVMFTADDGQFVGGSVRGSDGAVTCARPATFDSSISRYELELGRSCFGAPNRMRFYMSLGWDQQPSNPDNELAVDWVPNLDGPYYSGWVVKPCRVIPTRTTLPIYPERIHQGDAARLKGFVFRDGTDNGLGGLKVQLLKRPEGGEWRLENAKRTESNGEVRFAPRPVDDVQYRLRHPGTKCTTASLSPAREVRVVG